MLIIAYWLLACCPFFSHTSPVINYYRLPLFCFCRKISRIQDGIGDIAIVIRSFRGVIPFYYRKFFLHLPGGAAPVCKLPGMAVCFYIIFDVLNVLPTLQHHHLQPFFGEFFCSEPAGSAGAYNLIFVQDDLICLYHWPWEPAFQFYFHSCGR
jgi:hypothetical protein